MNDFRASLRRIFKFTVPVCISSIIFNLPKFFESRVVLMEKSDGSMVSEIDVTELRKNPTYAIYYNCWARIIITGLIPIVLLIYFNYKVYKDVTVSFSKKFVKEKRDPNAIYFLVSSSRTLAK